MKFTNEDLNLENGLNKEWIITNGLGGYASSTIIGANTRKYHGLLIAPLTPPARRYMILSKLDESVTVYGIEYPLYTNVCKNFISDGYKNLKSFEKEYLPKFTYQIKNSTIEKTICMKHMENTVVVLYKIKTGDEDIKLKIAPIMNFRDFHQMSINAEYTLKQENKKQNIKIIVNDNSSVPIYIKLSEGNYVEHNNDVFRNMYYKEEEKRGFFPEENHIVTGRYEIFIPKNTEKEIGFICSLEENIDEVDVKEIIKNEEERLKELVKGVKDEYIKQLHIAADSFVVYRPSFGLHTVIAGYPWFLDWGRDTLISFEGLFLKTKKYDLGKDVLKTIMRDIKYGLVPNGYSGFDNRPLYNSVDSSLLLFEQINKYLEYTGDLEFIKEKYEILKNIIKSYENGIDVDNNNIYLDKDGLLVSGTDETQNTWMDAKIGNYVVTPRNGKAVEINALWYNALRILKNFSISFNDEETEKYCNKLANKCKKSFNEKFYNVKKHCLYDVLGDSRIRPNQIFALALSYPIMDLKSEEAKNVFDTVSKKLLKSHGLKSLATGEKDYVATYEGDSFRRDMSYHQGITWVWLLGVYYDALRKLVQVDKTRKPELDKFIQTTKKTFEQAVLYEGCIGSISELYDSKIPYLPKGTFSQAWSVAEVLRIVGD